MATNHNRAYGEKRGPGRPKKDEVVSKPFVVHKSPRIKPENELKYAEEAIKTANNLYKRYRAKYPNPLNIDVMDLIPEAKMCWELIFSEREYTEEDVKQYWQRDRVLETPEEVLFAFECYVNYVRMNNFVREFERPDGTTGVMPIVPNQSNFARWLGISYMSVSRTMGKAEESHLASYKKVLGDCLSEGAMLGVYQSSSTIFTLKNLCDWADKYEDRSTKKDDKLAVEEAAELMKQLGYSRPQIGGEAVGSQLPSPADD